MKKLHLLILSTVAVLCACQESRTESHTLIDLESNLNKLPMEEFQLTPKETDAVLIPVDMGVIIGNHAIFGCWGDRIYLHDGRQVVAIDRTDGSVALSFQYVGNGPKEYRNIYKAQIDPNSGRIYVLSSQSDRILIFDTAGRYQQVVQLPQTASDMAINADGTVFVSFNAPQTSIRVYDKNHKMIKELRESEKQAGQVTNRSLRILGGEIYLAKNTSDTLSLVADTLVDNFVVRLGEKRMGAKSIDISAAPVALDQYITGERGLSSGNHYFTRYFYNLSQYFDVFDLHSGALLYREIVPVEALNTQVGIPIQVNGTIVTGFWPSFASDGFLYSMIDGVTAHKLFPNQYAEDSNGFIVQIKVN